MSSIKRKRKGKIQTNKDKQKQTKMTKGKHLVDTRHKTEPTHDIDSGPGQSEFPLMGGCRWSALICVYTHTHTHTHYT